MSHDVDDRTEAAETDGGLVDACLPGTIPMSASLEGYRFWDIVYQLWTKRLNLINCQIIWVSSDWLENWYRINMRLYKYVYV